MKWANPRKPQKTADKDAEIFNEAPVVLRSCFLNALPSSQHSKGQHAAARPWEKQPPAQNKEFHVRSFFGQDYKDTWLLLPMEQEQRLH